MCFIIFQFSLYSAISDNLTFLHCSSVKLSAHDIGNKSKAYQYWNMAKDNSFKAKENIKKLCSDPFNSEICKN